MTIEVTSDEIWELSGVVQDRYNEHLLNICKEKPLLRSFFLKTGVFDEDEEEILKNENA